MRATAIKLYRSANPPLLIGTSIGHRAGVEGRDSHEVRDTVESAIIDDELNDVGSCFIEGEGGLRGGAILERGCAPQGPGEDAPGEAERITVRVAGGGTIQRDGGTDYTVLIFARAG